MITWLASYPRSGNTLLRMLLWQVFGVRTPDLHPTSIPKQTFKLARFHVPHTLTAERIYKLAKAKERNHIIKTHEGPLDDAPAIYVIRDGRSATVSYFHYLNTIAGTPASLEDTVLGRVHLGSWSQHVEAWDPRRRPNTLTLYYDEVVQGDAKVIEKLSDFLKRKPHVSKFIHDFSALQSYSPNFFRAGNDTRNIGELKGPTESLFWALHGRVMGEFGFATVPPVQPDSLREAYLAERRQVVTLRQQLENTTAESQARLSGIQQQQELVRAFEKQLLESNADREARLRAMIQYQHYAASLQQRINVLQQEIEVINSDRDARLRAMHEQQAVISSFEQHLAEVNSDREKRLETIIELQRRLGDAHQS